MSLAQSAITYRITDARLVAIVKGGGAIVETGTFDYTEGRSVGVHGGSDQPPFLSVQCSFTVADAPTPDRINLSPARIVIVGTFDGQRVELRGRGFIGYTEHGCVEGHFRRLPVFLLDAEPASPKRDAPETSFDEWMARMGSRKPQPSSDYQRAVAGRGLRQHMFDDGGG